MHNRIYGILSLNKVQENDPCYHYSDVVCNKAQKEALQSLYTTIEDKDIGKLVCCLIQLMRSSENWSKFIIENDPSNTYELEDTKTIELADVPTFTFDQLKTWANTKPITIGDYRHDSHESTITNIINKLFSVVLLK